MNYPIYDRYRHFEFLNYDRPIKLSFLTPEQYNKLKIKEIPVVRTRERSSEYATNKTPVMCLETGEVFETVKDAANSIPCFYQVLLKAMKTNGGYTKGKHYAKLNGRTPEEMIQYWKEHPDEFKSKKGK